MLLYTVRRLIASVLVLLASSALVFVLVATTIDPLAQYRTRQPPPPPQFFEQKRAELGLDKPIFQRYWDWLSGVVHGDFGNNIAGNPVGPTLFTRLGVTARMVIAAMVLSVLLAVIVGVYTAVRKNHAADYVATVISYMLIALPIFWFAVLLKEFVAIRFNDLVGQTVLYTQGEESPGISLYASGWELWKDRLSHLILPTIALTGITYAAWSRFQRASMLDVMSSEYMRFARAKGVPWRRVLIKHGLRNALIPLTTVVAIGVGAIFGGAILTETVFNWNGMGRYFTQDGLGQSDLNVVLGWLIVSAFFVVLFNLIADLLYAVLDPRIRLS
ncbi:MAG: ABC transporter permease [Mycobacteriales bacterium]